MTTTRRNKVLYWGATIWLALGYPILKEWAYAGFFFTMTGAIISHLAIGDEDKPGNPNL
ncbi:MAG: DoxX family protein [Saprospiraceae bacterium]|nr:DoxX family protein [Saprospiraceae bacterium]